MNPLVNRVQGMKRSFRQLGTAKVPWVVVIALLAIQVGIESAGGYELIPWWFNTFGLSRAGESHGMLWQPFSYALLHANWAHALVNAFCLLMLGTRIEHALGSSVALRGMLWGVLGGAVGHLLLSAPHRDSLLVGSSGGAFGLMILTTTLGPESRMWPVPISGRVLGFSLLTSSLALALMDPMFGLPGLSEGGRWLSREGFSSCWAISHACHFGGGMAGWAYGRWLLRPRITLERLRRERAKREGA